MKLIFLHDLEKAKPRNKQSIFLLIWVMVFNKPVHVPKRCTSHAYIFSIFPKIYITDYVEDNFHLY